MTITIPAAIRSEVRFSRENGLDTRLEAVVLPLPLARSLATEYHSVPDEYSDGFCFVCRRATDHRGEHSDWQYVAREMGLL